MAEQFLAHALEIWGLHILFLPTKHMVGAIVSAKEHVSINVG